MKRVEVTISAVDSDHNPTNGAQTISIITNAPWLTAGRIIEGIRRIAEAEDCKIIDYDVFS